ncbi:hypothetical protein [Rhodococcus qingshengii]|uniref:Uncharacterized protein n=1 Tax=Rhodococcus qingshengii TaxID=334542 RepID=A0A2A5IXF9_RHOSG|nr:hypothetical protein [Rhodococcus qingshengii]PCK22008.1 hypothetical protein CHR55_33265 [Rhodococcus qingshengii]
MTVSVDDFGGLRDVRPMMDRTIVGVIRTTLLRESGLLDPGFADIAEAHQLAETVIHDVVADLAHGSKFTTELRATLRDLVDLVASAPETDTVEQVQTVALTLRRILDHTAVPADSNPR